MSTKTPEGNEHRRPEADGSGQAAAREEGGALPAIVLGGAILAIVALLVLWPSSDEDEAAQARAAAISAGAERRGPEGAAAGKGGIQARAVDEASRPRRSRLNPNVHLPPAGMKPAPPPPPEDPPASASVDEKIAFYEKKLDRALEEKQRRTLFVERLDRAEERAKQSDDPSQLELFERRKKKVLDNYERAAAEVERIEKKLDELR